MPACCGSNDRIWMGLPFEGFRVDVVLGEVLIDGALEVDDAEEGAASEPALGKRREEALHRVQLGGARRGEVERDPRMSGEPSDHLRVLVDRVVVDDDVHGFGGRDGLLDGLEEADELPDTTIADLANQRSARATSAGLIP